MSAVEVLGRDPALGAYRLRTQIGAQIQLAWVPECLIDTGWRPGERPTHQEAYEWIAAHRSQLRAAISRRLRGDTPRAPFDLVTLIAEDPYAR